MLTVDQKKEPAQFVLEDKIVKRSGIFRTAVFLFSAQSLMGVYKLPFTVDLHRKIYCFIANCGQYE